MGFFAEVRRQYGTQATDVLNEIKDRNSKLSNLRNRRIFLLRCRTRQVIPKHIVNNVKCVWSLFGNNKKFYNKINGITSRLKKSILNIEIAITEDEIKGLEDLIQDSVKSAKQFLPHDLVNNYLASLYKGNHAKKFNQVKLRQKKKLDALVSDQIGHNMIGNVDNIKNISNTQIPEHIEKFLSLGPRFAVEPSVKEMDTKRLMADLEYGIRCLDVPEHEKDEKRNKIVNVVTNFKNHNDVKKSNPLINVQYNDTKEFLKENDNLVILNSDKGNVTVILDKDNYNEKINDLLNDESTYKKLENDPTENIQRKTNAMIRKLYENGHIDKNQRSKLTRYNSVPPKIYGNPKVHKQGVPLRPVVSCINSPVYNLSKFIDKILNKVTKPLKYNVKNSFQVAKLLKGMVLPENHKLVSFDAKSLFTNVKKDAVLNSISTHWAEISNHTSLSLDEFKEIVSFIFDNSYFSYQNVIYQQISGSAMGSPSSCVFANLVMFDILKEFEEQIGIDIHFLYLYVDDVIACVPSNMVDKCLNTLNSISVDVQFTCENEIDSKIPFLDLLLIRENDTLLIDYYRKPTSSNRILNFRSHHPMKQKISIVKQNLHKIRNLCSKQFIERNIANLKELLRQNNFPKGLINRLIYCQPKEKLNENKDEVKKFIKVPYHNRITKKLNNVFKNNNVHLASYNPKTSAKFFGKVKDKVPVNNQSSVVYKLDCSCNKSYIGQTKQYLKSRIDQHKRDIRNGNSNTGLSEHVFETGHSIDWKNVKIIDREDNDHKRRFLEMAHIINDRNLLNKQTDYDDFKNVYNHVLKK